MSRDKNIAESNPILALHDRYQKQSLFSDRYERHNVPIRRDLHERLQAICLGKPKGFKLDFLNEAIEMAVNMWEDRFDKNND